MNNCDLLPSNTTSKRSYAHCSPPLVCKYLGNFLNLILTMFTNKVSEGRWLTIFTIKFNFVLTIDNLIYIFENQITNIEHHLLNIGYQISSIKY